MAPPNMPPPDSDWVPRGKQEAHAAPVLIELQHLDPHRMKWRLPLKTAFGRQAPSRHFRNTRRFIPSKKALQTAQNGGELHQ
jgi:hypothetical protein